MYMCLHLCKHYTDLWYAELNYMYIHVVVARTGMYKPQINLNEVVNPRCHV